MKRTKAIEILDNAKVPYELKEFDAECFTAKEAASKLNISSDIVFKTLVCRAAGKGDTVMALVPATKELNLKKLAEALAEKRCELIAVNEMQRITGYLKGGCSPLGGKKKMEVLIDSSASNYANICVSAGLRGLQILICPSDLVKLTGGRVVSLCY